MVIDTLQLALDYLAFNPTRFLFPIKAGAKFPPLIQDNLAAASNDPEQIKAWAKKWPGCNWGVSLKKSNLMVADVDTKPGKNGQATFDDLDLMYGWPETERVKTPSGGYHLYYDGEHIFALGKHGFGPDIDSPNYVLMCGCVFKDGTSYVAGNARASVPAPQWFYDVIKASKTKIANVDDIVVDLDKPENIEWVIDYLKEDAEPAIEGKSGDHTTLRIAMSVKDAGISRDLAIELMNEHYNPRCEPPWDIEDLTRKVDNAYAYAKHSKTGGKTAEADFAEDVDFDPLTIKPKGDPKKAAKSARDRREDRKREAAKSDDEKERFCTIKDIMNEWVWVANIERFVNMEKTEQMWKTTAMDRTFLYLEAKNPRKSVSDQLLEKKKGAVARAHSMVYLPGTTERFLEQGTMFNLYRPSDVIPAEGDTTMWRDHLAYLFPDERDRNLVLNWVAWMIQNLDKKPKHALLVQGHKQGTGKSFIAEVLQLILGKSNVAPLTQNDLHGDFNGWALKAKLIWIEELRALDRAEVKNKLHPLITQERIRINDKNVSAYPIENCFGIFAMTNDDAAVALDNSDRRYLVVRTDAIPRNHTDFGEGFDPNYYKKLYGLLNDPAAVAAIAHELITRDLGEYDARGSAPETAAKSAMIDAGLSDLETWMVENASSYPLNGRVIQIPDIVASLPKRLDHSPRLTQVIGSVLKHRFKGVKIGQFRVAGHENRPHLWLINGSGLMNIEGWKDQVANIYLTDRAKAGKIEADSREEGDSATDEFAD